MPDCQNCRHPLDGDYCSKCGQRRIDLDRPIWRLAADLLRETFELDGRVARSLKTLFMQPGTMTREFLEGRRRHYSSPLRLYLALSVTFFLFAAWLAGSGALLDPGQQGGDEAADQAEFLAEDLPRLMFVLMPIFALLLKIIYPRRLYFDHLVFSLHLHSAAYVVLAVMLPLENLATRHTVFLVAQAALLAAFLAYVMISMRRVYDSSWPGVLIRSAALLVGYLFVVSLVIESTSSFLIIAD